VKKILGFLAGSQAYAYKEAARKKEGSLAAMADPDALVALLTSSRWSVNKLRTFGLSGMLSDMGSADKIRKQLHL